jgi:predicted lipoprotein with Yx(FWY)xxD motif
VKTTVRLHSGPTARRLLGGSVIFGATVVAVAACGSSSGSSASGSSASPSAAGSSAAAGSASAGAASSSSVTVSAKNVSGVGTVLVNGEGRVLYMFTPEKGGKITCTTSSGCIKFWPEIDLPSGTTAAKAGPGVKSSLLGTVKGATGTEVTYNGWPLYTFAGDSAAGTAKGQGQVSFGGTWYVLNGAGSPVTAKTTSGSSSSGSTTSGSSGAYGY